MAQIDVFLRDELHLDLSPKSQIVPATQGCEFVGYRVTPHGLRLRKKTIRHIKSCLKHISELYAANAISYDSAMQSLQSYMGMTVNCNAHSVRLWIERNIAFQRKEAA